MREIMICCRKYAYNAELKVRGSENVGRRRKRKIDSERRRMIKRGERKRVERN